ncbi:MULTISPECIES: bifunctional 4-hydroxy-2-oxoglutarate aldolase/2-dehydro-3-deoxy-phosphogluconate aldolase [Emticicia]|uniref:bifunctional 4-hydroxy-2-oxoglutarate aldolase/2-dehydro-3-deoxy-phosphogluconate aldolase n=1 Tax=Emticicia TaxID=312278 RepID=UPI0020A1A513|nr:MULTISPECIES: bifunctional 4-hydroxy-2-oxoglutarate aldolase/2-dehydro-3-deoxy-phosphogluconate aldolase [Emticicia]UTA67888.1 bifunctional 4-hydroxy-2-oxoglutarate aldolase/2-dehydro-3-deoxy-phosphogluconate aldolase [Emticicia sp. 21SJ11W-3]
MARFDKNTTLAQVSATGLVPLFTHNDLDICLGVLRACYQAGVRVFEFTNRTENSFNNFKELVSIAETEMPEMILGIGTIYDAATAKKYIEIGTNFIVAPIMNPEVGAVCVEAGIPWMPGVMTVTEIYNARQAGAEFIKIFPGEVLGPAFVKALKAPMPDVQVMVTGGVSPTAESLKTWFGAGATAVGIGSQLVPKEVLATKDFAQVTSIVANALQIIKEVKA